MGRRYRGGSRSPASWLQSHLHGPPNRQRPQEAPLSAPLCCPPGTLPAGSLHGPPPSGWLLCLERLPCFLFFKFRSFPKPEVTVAEVRLGLAPWPDGVSGRGAEPGDCSGVDSCPSPHLRGLPRPLLSPGGGWGGGAGCRETASTGEGARGFPGTTPLRSAPVRRRCAAR